MIGIQLNLTSLGLRRALIVAATIVLCACGSSAPSTPLAPTAGGGQSQTVCSYDMSVTALEMPAAGGAVTVRVTATEGCAWTAASSSSFLAVSTSTGTGTGSVTVTATANTAAARIGTVSIAGKTVTVSQADGSAPVATCTYSLSRTSWHPSASGASVTVEIETQPGCVWTASVTESFITIESGASGTGSGTISLEADRNTGEERHAALSAGGQTMTIDQDRVTSCTYSVSATSLSIAAGGSTVHWNVTTAEGCTWTASASNSWIVISSGAAQSGAGTAIATITANPPGSPARSASVTVAGQSFAVSQAAGAAICSYSVAAPDLDPIIAATGATVMVGVTTTPGCSWTASSSNSWIVVSSGAIGTGSGAVTLIIAPNANSAPARVGSVTIAGKTVTVSQYAGAANCTFTLGTSEIQTPLPPAAATVHVTVTTTPGCMWDAVSQTGWLTITAGASGNGSGTVTMTVASNTLPNPGPPGTLRIAFVTIAGQLRSVAQYYQ